MKLTTLYAENFKLDGGACFGVVPKSIWGKSLRADDQNLIPICTRLLLIEVDDKKILIDTGVGHKQDEKFKQMMHLSGLTNLSESLIKLGITANEITDVIFTHLHFDHVGGATSCNSLTNKIELTFPNANYWCSEAQYKWAVHEHSSRERASYLKENIALLKDKLSFIKSDTINNAYLTFTIVNGHTPGQVIPYISYKNRTIVYVADFIPSLAHIPISYVAGYDVEPLIAMEEKELFLNEAVANNYILLFQHDMMNECCTVKQTIKGIRPAHVFTLKNM